MFDSKSGQRELKYLEEKEFSPRYASPSPRIWGFVLSLFMLFSSASNQPLLLSLSQNQSLCHKGSCTRDGTACIPHRDVHSFINTICTLNKGFVFVLFCFLVVFFFISSLRELKAFICYFLRCIFCTKTVYNMSFA